MSTSNAGTGGGVDFAGLISTISSQPDPLAYLVHYLKEQRIPAQGPFFHIHAYTALGVHGSIVLVMLLATWTRSRRDQLWFTRRQQGRLRLNATVIASFFIVIYSSMAIVYTTLSLRQQKSRQYLAGSAAFQLSCFSAVSVCISVITFTYHQSLPVGFEGSFFRTLFHKKHAAVDGRFFSFAFLCVWVVISLAGLMTFPIIHDYWRRQADSNIQGIITYLEREDVRERGLSALIGIADQFSELPQQVKQAQVALQRQLLVFAAHCGIYLLALVPVAIKLITLLSKQMRALRRSAEDYFRLGTRIKEAPRSHKLSNAKQPLLGVAPAFQMQDKVTTPKVAIVTCSNCSHDIPINVAFAASKTPERINGSKRRRLQLPQYDGNPDFPLHKLHRLKRVRKELVGFSIIIILGLCNFLAWSCVSYWSIPRWSSAEMTANLFVISLWSYAAPAGIGSIFYAYTTALLPKTKSSSSSTAASQRSGPTKSSSSDISRPSFWRRLPFFKRQQKYAGWEDIYRQEQARIIENKRSRPTFPRMPSMASFGGPLTPAIDMEILAKGKEYDYTAYQSPISTLQWIEDQKREASRNATIQVPSLALRPKVSLNSLRGMSRRPAPLSMTQSWLEIDED